MRVVLQEIESEHARQDGIGITSLDQTNTRNDWVAIVTAYVGRAGARVARNEREGADFRSNMLKAASAAIKAIEAHDKGWC